VFPSDEFSFKNVLVRWPPGRSPAILKMFPPIKRSCFKMYILIFRCLVWSSLLTRVLGVSELNEAKNLKYFLMCTEIVDNSIGGITNANIVIISISVKTFCHEILRHGDLLQFAYQVTRSEHLAVGIVHLKTLMYILPDVFHASLNDWSVNLYVTRIKFWQMMIKHLCY